MHTLYTGLVILYAYANWSCQNYIAHQNELIRCNIGNDDIFQMLSTLLGFRKRDDRYR